MLATPANLAHHGAMPDQVLALLATAGWIVLVAVILALFGTTSGGAWSIAGSVARGVRDWSGHEDARADTASVTPPTSTAPRDSEPSSPRAELDDHGERPVRD